MSGLATLEVDARIVSPPPHHPSMTGLPVIGAARALAPRNFLEIQ
jgi:hypothetical protein